MSKVRVEILVESLAGYGDAQPDVLARKYAKIEREMRGKVKMSNNVKVPIYSDDQIKVAVNAEKAKDAAEPKRGFDRDYSFKRGDKPLVEEKVADNWEASGVAVLIQESKAGK